MFGLLAYCSSLMKLVKRWLLCVDVGSCSSARIPVDVLCRFVVPWLPLSSRAYTLSDVIPQLPVVLISCCLMDIISSALREFSRP